MLCLWQVRFFLLVVLCKSFVRRESLPPGTGEMDDDGGIVMRGYVIFESCLIALLAIGEIHW